MYLAPWITSNIDQIKEIEIRIASASTLFIKLVKFLCCRDNAASKIALVICLFMVWKNLANIMGRKSFKC